ncbi:flagellar biosynthetic protein FliR [Noviherbaspirillum suwonense]|jgi:flagellar biosynthetic protein FliR|uniref:Flagellar biosynthetic protein FliR n=1 Tax=Noviherbaspirillum suwonense TaxID=1224511 RepID=A0ABY1QLA1_9BURK|nr:flagellar biosynthetic protein FliR [Noviherbaspirillum suwonense]SMP74726.1 flagellar biosynthetic protein FliR [Noviherbaspirillum suwonense]
MTALHIDAQSLLAGLLLSIRLGMVLFMTPVLGGAGVPARIRVLALLALTSCLTLALAPSIAVDMRSTPAVLMAMVHEALWGGLMGFGLNTAFAAFLVGGRLLDLQMGFGVATLFDPGTRTQVPLLGLLLQMTGIAAFLGVDGHHMALRGLALSVRAAPLGSSPLGVSPAVVLQQFGLMFSLGMMLVSAAVLCVFLADAGMSVVARVLPQANVFLLSIPVKIVAGLSVLAMSAPLMGPVLLRIFESVFRYWDALPGR